MAHPRSRTLPDLLDEITARDPAHELIVGGGERISYAETRARARRLAKGLLRLGIRRGDKVALLMGNRPEWLVIDFAVTMLGATLVPVSTWSRARELGYVLDHCDTTTLITIARFAGHRSTESTLLYIHLSGRDLARAFRRAAPRLVNRFDGL